MAVKRIFITTVLALGLVFCGMAALSWYNTHAKDNGNSHLSKSMAAHGVIRPNHQNLLAAHGVIRPNAHGVIRPNAHGVIRPNAHGVIRPNHQSILV